MALLWLIAVVGCLTWLVLYVVRFFTKRQAVPGPRGLPGLGVTLTAQFHMYRRLDWLVDLVNEHGPILRAKIVGQPPVTLATTPEAVEHALKSNFENYEKGDMVNTLFEELLGDGIFNSDGPTWSHQRKTASHMFSARMLRDSMTTVFAQNMPGLCAAIGAKQGAQPFDIQDIFFRYTLDSIGQVAFGVNLNSLSNKDVPFARAFDYLQARFANRFVRPWWRMQGFVERLLGLPRHRLLVRSLRTLDQFAKEVIATRRQDPALASRKDLLSLFMTIKSDEQGEFDDTYLRNVIMNFTIAGRDTTAQALSWSVYNLATHPDVEARMMAELDQVLPTRELDYTTAFSHLPFTMAVIKETLRLFPSVPVDQKVAKADDILPGGMHVPKGTIFMYAPYVMGRRTELWGADAAQWRPRRWLSMDKEPSQFKFTAFNAGKRLCLGKNVALLEAVMVLAKLYSKWSFKLQPGRHVTYALSVTLPVKDGLFVTAHPRTSS